MEKQRMFKMSQLEQDMLVKALCDTQNDVQPEQAEEMRSLAAKTVRAPRRRLYLSDEEFGRAVQALNRKRNAYLSAGRSSVGFRPHSPQAAKQQVPAYAGQISPFIPPEACGFSHELRGAFLFLQKGGLFLIR